MKKRIRKRILAVLLAAVLAVGNSAPAVLEALAAGNAEEELVTEELTRYPVVPEGEDKELPAPPELRYEEELGLAGEAENETESVSEPEASGNEMLENTESSEEEEAPAAEEEENPEESGNKEEIPQAPEESGEEQKEPEMDGEREQLSQEEGSVLS